MDRGMFPSVGGGVSGGDLNISPGNPGDYASAYNSAFQYNQAMYKNALSAYQQVQAQQTSASEAISKGYNQLYNTVLDTISGIEASQKQAIEDTYTAQSGDAMQKLISKGMGNKTVQESIARGLLADKAKAQTALANQTAGLKAGYQSNLAMAGLNAAQQANMANTALGVKTADFMASPTAPYPKMADYLNQDMMKGMLKQGLGGQAIRPNPAGSANLKAPATNNPPTLYSPPQQGIAVPPPASAYGYGGPQQQTLMPEYGYNSLNSADQNAMSAMNSGMFDQQNSNQQNSNPWISNYQPQNQSGYDMLQQNLNANTPPSWWNEQPQPGDQPPLSTPMPTLQDNSWMDQYQGFPGFDPSEY